MNNFQKLRAEYDAMADEIKRFHASRIRPHSERLRAINSESEEIRKAIRSGTKKPSTAAEVLAGVNTPAPPVMHSGLNALILERLKIEDELREVHRQSDLLAKEIDGHKRNYLRALSEEYSKMLTAEIAKNRKVLDRIFALARLSAQRLDGHSFDVPECSAIGASGLMRGIFKHGYDFDAIDCATVAAEVEPKK